MSITNGYATLVDVKAALAISDTADDTLLELAVESASRAIDGYTNRRFWQDPTAVSRYYAADAVWQPNPSTRVYSYNYVSCLTVDDISTSTGLVVKTDGDADGVFETTLTLNTDFYLSPVNAAADGLPWTYLELAPNTTAYWPSWTRGVEVTAKFGWPSIPTAVKQACLIQAARFFSRKNSPYGIAGSPELGNELRLLSTLDADVRVMLSQYRLAVIA